MLKIVQRNRDSQLDLVGDLRLISHQMLHMCQACQKLKCHASWSTTGQKVQTDCSATSRLASSVLKNLTLHIPFSPQYKILLIPMKCKELLERILREKPQRKTRLTHLQSSHRDSLNSSTLILSIVTSLRGSLPKHFLIIPTSVRRPFGAWEAIRKGPISYWLMLWAIVESDKLKKKQVRRNLIGVGAQRASVHWVDQAWRAFYCSCISTTFFNGLFTTWKVTKRFYAEGFGFLFDNTSCVVFVFASLFP